MYKIDKIHCIRLDEVSIDKAHCTMYNKTITRGNTPSKRTRETHSPSRQDAKRTHAPGPHNITRRSIT